MTAFRSFDVEREVREGRARTRRAMTASAIAHALLLAWFVFFRQDAPDAAPLVEITLIESADAGAPAPAVRAVAAVSSAAESDEHFRRTRATGEVRPEAADASIADRLAARLATLRSDAEPQVAGIGSSPTPLASTLPAVVGGQGSGGTAPLALRRGGGTGSGPALELSRGPAGSAALAPAAAPPVRSAAAEAPAGGGDAGERRSLAGASIAGPIADRPILSFVRPVYPEWAKRDAVEGTVTLYFVVRPDGSVKENVLVQRTAGFEDFDENARAALRAWRFEPLRGGRAGEQWGTITFRYRLEGGG